MEEVDLNCRNKLTCRPRSNVARALEILSLFDNHNHPVRSSEILTQLGISASTGYPLLRAMLTAGLLEKPRHGFLRLGPTARSWILWGADHGESLDLKQYASESALE